MDHIALDAVLDWLDAGALLATGCVCRAWRERVVRPEAWRERPFPLAWGRGMDVRRAWSGSLGAMRRWRREAWTERRLKPPAPDDVWADGDWLAWEKHRAFCGRSRRRRRRRSGHAGLVLYDASTGRRVALSPDQVPADTCRTLALSSRRGLVAVAWKDSMWARRYGCGVWDVRSDVRAVCGGSFPWGGAL